MRRARQRSALRWFLGRRRRRAPCCRGRTGDDHRLAVEVARQMCTVHRGDCRKVCRQTVMEAVKERRRPLAPSGPSMPPTHGRRHHGRLRRDTDRRTHHRHSALRLAVTILIVVEFITWRDRCTPGDATGSVGDQQLPENSNGTLVKVSSTIWPLPETPSPLNSYSISPINGSPSKVAAE